MYRLPKVILKALKERNLDWELVGGKKHMQLRVEGQLVGILPRGGGSTESGHHARNLAAQVKRFRPTDRYRRHNRQK